MNDWVVDACAVPMDACDVLIDVSMDACAVPPNDCDLAMDA